MAGIDDLRARQVAAAMVRAVEKASRAIVLAGFAGHPYDPDDPSAWKDADLFAAYRDLEAVLAGAHQTGLGDAPIPYDNCLSCRYFAALKSARADKPPEPINGVVERGFCTAHPPQRMNTNPTSDPLGSTMWIHVHGEHRCGEWRSLATRREA